MLRRRPILAAVVVVLAGCSSSEPSVPASPSPAATTVATTPVTPSPTATDVASAFATQIQAATRGQLVLSGSMTINGELATISGTETYAGPDVDVHERLVLAGVTTDTEIVVVGGTLYTRVAAGPWIKAISAAPQGAGLAGVLQAATHVTDLGLATKDGRLLHRLTLPSGTSIPPSAFGLNSSIIANPQVAATFWADDTGKPVEISVAASWSQGAASVQMTLDATYSAIGQGVVAVPPDVWNSYASTRFRYAIVYPTEWDVSTAQKTFDVFESPTDTNLLVGRYATKGFSLNAIVKAIIANSRKHGMVETSNDAAVAGTKPARLITYHQTVAGKKWVAYEVLVVNGNAFWDLIYWADAGHEAADLATFKEIISGFVFV